MTKKNIIAWDLGATKCAAALVEYDQEKNLLNCKIDASVKIKSCQSLADLTAQLESSLGMPIEETDAVCIGAAGQYDGEYLKLESGYPYPMGFAKLIQQQNWPKTAIIHDYSPIVCATFTSYMEQPENIKRLNTYAINPYGRRVTLGIGTGLGLKDGILFSNGDFWLGTNEMGHIGVPTPPLADKVHQERHRELLAFLRSEGVLQANEPLTFEKLLSGQGLVNLHAFFHPNTKNHSPEEVGMLVGDGQADETLALFAWYLGLLVGTVQLTFMPDGGIWITGGVILNHLQIFDYPEFFQGLEASPAYLQQRQQFPLGILCNPQHAFMGGAYYASKRLL